MKNSVLSAVLLLSLVTNSAWAQELPEITQLQELQLSETQVQSLMGLFFSRAPMLLGDSVDTEALISELAPQALGILTSEQRRLLSELAPEENIRRFGSMNREQRTRFIFDNAKTLVHPSKKEWLDRVEEMNR